MVSPFGVVVESCYVRLNVIGNHVHSEIGGVRGAKGLIRELSPGPLAPETRIIPLDQAANRYRLGKLVSR